MQRHLAQLAKPSEMVALAFRLLGQQHVDERIVQCLQELDDGVRRFVMDLFSYAVACFLRRPLSVLLSPILDKTYPVLT